ncbi:MAG TPA: glycine cleavage system protein GcvH [Clostridiales bacterium]|nr:glycine cleavage system protein GcvH [Clostridiales bacterium]
MKILNELKYSKSHEWVKVEGKEGYLRITDYAQDHLGEVVFADCREVGRGIKIEESVAVIESVKAVADIFSPISGTVVEVNEALLDNPAEINSDPYNSWFIAVEMTNESELDALLSSSDYEKICE